MYLLGWVVLVVVSLVLSLGALAWAFRSGQFADQARARYLALEGGPPPETPPRRGRLPVEAYALAAVALLGALWLLSPVALSLVRRFGG